ncbi:DHA2 family efflux MFS transporter permease subunit [Rhizobium sp. L1K21]|uniref:DHA2 family efflux MFS transporter permease subunit n=1 Tax=Rhizobium sp. L1K21 TaxID=2954933 RepID=UPI0020933790|nr:DHA2 family efflux MFS transporter permease subunit [Rhizobium sp. L1K21]MCO6187029.1 DHA2 family efflux MFS transporter permease subunit [Rhizobium sp. L1K21]
MNRIVPLILAFAFFMEMMDSTVIATSLPAIAADIGVNPITLKLALTSYLVALGMFIPVSGWLADKFGAKRVFRLAILVFVIGSVACALSSSLTEFVIFRFLQGMGGSMMTPVGRLVLVRSTPKERFVSAMTLVTVPGLVGPMAGPPLGGFITTYFSWHWIFIVNVPIGLLGIWLSGLYLPEIPRLPTPKMDWRGFALTAIAASGLVFGLSVISMPALPPAVGVLATLTGLAALFAYIRHAKRVEQPILNPSLFKVPVFRVSILGSTIFRVATGAQPFLVPLFLQLGFGLNPFQSGMITFSGAFGALSTKLIATRVLSAVGFRTTMITAAIFGTLSILAVALFEPGTPYWLIVATLFLGGFTRSFLFTSANSLAFTSVPAEEASQATSISSVFQQISIALGVALAGLVLESSYWLNGTELSIADFHLAFIVTGILCGLSVLSLAALPKTAGADVSGHRMRNSEV